MTITTLFAIFLSHWIADFVLQTDWMAKNKSSNWRALTEHVLVYQSALAMLMIALSMIFSNPIPMSHLLVWAVTNGAGHFVVDAVTSRITSALFKAGRIHDFFVVIGLDQMIHMMCLVGTWSFV